MATVNIRQASPSDASSVSQLRLEALHAHPEAFSSHYLVESARSLADWEAQIQRADANAKAIRFYACRGFRVYGLEPRAIRHDSVDYDDLLMALEL